MFDMSPSVFAIVGGGLTGTAMLVQFVRALRTETLAHALNPKGSAIQVIEREADFGPGFPHGERYMLPFHLTNMCARDMGIVADKPNDFEEWVDDRRDRVLDILSDGNNLWRIDHEPSESCRHYPRTLMGAYLKARFQDAVSTATSMGATVDFYPEHEATDLEEDPEGVRIIVKALRSGATFELKAHRLLLATGHWRQNKDQGRVISSPWPARALQMKIPRGASVAVLGTSLTALDTVLTLTADGAFSQTDSGSFIYHPSDRPRRITLYSRSGRLPKVRGRTGPYRNRFIVPGSIQSLLNRNGRLFLKDLFELLDADLNEAYGRAFDWEGNRHPPGTVRERLERDIRKAETGDGPNGDILWQTVLQQTFPMARWLYLSLSRDDRHRFDRHYNTLFFVHAAPMPLVNARKLLALMEADLVSVAKLGESFQLRTDHRENGITLCYRGPDGQATESTHPYLVDARGQELSYEKNPDVLAVNLLRSGTVEIAPANDDRPSDLTTAEPHRDNRPASRSRPSGAGGLWIDPQTHRVQRSGPNGAVIASEKIYAVGAMTRGQIIDASMAYGSAVSTAAVAQEWIRQILYGRRSHALP
jgi:uncharacterized NAD(P)/FAD-binding protein YdhS